MKTYIVFVQCPHGPRANPLNHIAKAAVSAVDSNAAEVAAIKAVARTNTAYDARREG